MMGRSHAMSGVLAGVATSWIAGPDPVNQAAWVVVIGGAALLPDLDMPHSTVGKLWGPLSGGLRVKMYGRSVVVVPGFSHFVNGVAGGHRKGTHSILGILATVALIWLAGLGLVTSAFMLAVAVGLVILAVDFYIPGRMHWATNLAICAGVGAAAYSKGWGLPGWLPVAIGIGMVVHCVGDDVTKARVPWAWPFHVPRSKEEKESWWRFKTGGPVEQWVLRVIVAATVVVLMYRAGYDPAGAIITALRELRA